jgi:hypothetical protein
LRRARIRGPLWRQDYPTWRRQNHHPLGEDFCQLASSLRMAVPLLITTSRTRALSTWRCVSGKACRSSSRLSLGRRPVLGRTTASPTSLRLARQVSASD